MAKSGKKRTKGGDRGAGKHRCSKYLYRSGVTAHSGSRLFAGKWVLSEDVALNKCKRWTDYLRKLWNHIHIMKRTLDAQRQQTKTRRSKRRTDKKYLDTYEVNRFLVESDYDSLLRAQCRRKDASSADPSLVMYEVEREIHSLTLVHRILGTMTKEQVNGFNKRYSSVLRDTETAIRRLDACVVQTLANATTAPSGHPKGKEPFGKLHMKSEPRDAPPPPFALLVPK